MLDKPRLRLVGPLALGREMGVADWLSGRFRMREAGGSGWGGSESGR